MHGNTIKLGFHGATSMRADIPTDLAASAQAGFKMLELWAAKVNRFLADHSLAELQALFQKHHVAPMTFNSIEFIAFRSDDFGTIKDLAIVAPVPSNSSALSIGSGTPCNWRSRREKRLSTCYPPTSR